MAYYSKYSMIPEYVYFGGLHSYTDLGMVLESWDVGIPQKKTIKATSDLANGDVDITDSYSVAFNNRTIKLTFRVLEGKSDYNYLYTHVCRALNGEYFDYADDLESGIYISAMDRYYAGRVSINSITSNKLTGTIEVDIDAQPRSYGSIYQSGLMEFKFTAQNTFLADDGNSYSMYYAYNSAVTDSAFHYAPKGSDLYVYVQSVATDYVRSSLIDDVMHTIGSIRKWVKVGTVATSEAKYLWIANEDSDSYTHILKFKLMWEENI